MFYNWLKKRIPPKVMAILSILKKYYLAYCNYSYDRKRYLRYSFTIKKNSKDKMEYWISICYHVIEKGLSMPNTKVGFGKEYLKRLITALDDFYQKYGDESQQFKNGVLVLKKYLEFNQKFNVTIDKNILDTINKYYNEENFVNNKAGAIEFSKIDLEKLSIGNFEQLAFARHSIRNYTDINIPQEKIIKAIEIAQQSPSVCNRQASRLYIINNKNIMKEVLCLQNGNRGFGEIANKVIVITSDLQAFDGIHERNQAYCDAGMYSMSLLYALQYQKIGACSLNWCTLKNKDMQLKKLLGIPENEIVVMLIAIGEIPEKVKVACSQRKNIKEVYRII